MRHLLKTAALVLVLGLANGCGDDGAAGETTATGTPAASQSTSELQEPSASPTEETSSEAPEPEGTVVRVTVEDGQVTPNGERIEARAGEPIVFEIVSDTSGELHAHATPEHSIEFRAGTSRHEIVIDQPGIVEVELHDPALVVVQLEVR